ncbi:MAG: TetR/AcrR family transcriptional regulator [Hyphomicrobiales bacterium]|nr:TetR/AcrR family transcriptional regulator [Hyphomicrobiales bacterium]
MNEKVVPTSKAEKIGRYHHGNLKETLLEAAQAELADQGIEKLSLRAIAKRAGVSHAAPAHHFGDVNGLLTALAARGFGMLMAAQKLRLDTARPDPVSQLVALGLGYIDFATANPAMFRLAFSSKRPNFDDPGLHEPAKLAYDMLGDGVSALRDQSPASDLAVMADVASMWAMVHGLGDLLASGRIKYLQALTAEECEAVLIEIIRRAMPSLEKS